VRYEGKRGGAGWACMVVATINSCRDVIIMSMPLVIMRRWFELAVGWRKQSRQTCGDGILSRCNYSFTATEFSKSQECQSEWNTLLPIQNKLVSFQVAQIY